LAGAPVPPGQVVVIGDTPMDIQAGRAIGARTVAVATGPFRVSELETFKPDLALSDFNDPGLVESTLEAWQ
jgi:phosphoglycolate phosphatase-like HAD superfamily hydrolase